MTPFDYAGTTALVTGASSGIGKVFAQKLAGRGVRHLVLVARRESELRAVAESCEGAQVDVVSCDLGVPRSYRQVVETVGADGVDVLVNSAGFATYGGLEDQDEDAVQEEIELNCAALVGLTQALLPSMRARRSGVIVNVSSTAAFQPLPYMSVYGATKAFVLSFSEALWGENRSSGVRILALCPGATETPFFDRVGATEASVGTRQSPEAVVEVALRAIDRQRLTVISGRRNLVLAQASRFAPRRLVVEGARVAMRPRSVSAR